MYSIELGKYASVSLNHKPPREQEQGRGTGSALTKA
jgi:hypothetical protein